LRQEKNASAFFDLSKVIRPERGEEPEGFLEWRLGRI
jgi:hypothetical protein